MMRRGPRRDRVNRYSRRWCQTRRRWRQDARQFCLVTVAVRNVSDETVHYNANFQKAFSDAGTTYLPDLSAGWVANDSQTSVVFVSPGQIENLTLVYDVPKDRTISRLELHSSPLSAGAIVRIG
jgi:Domain of unknown function (DUF4352)